MTPTHDSFQRSPHGLFVRSPHGAFNDLAVEPTGEATLIFMGYKGAAWVDTVPQHSLESGNFRGGYFPSTDGFWVTVAGQPSRFVMPGTREWNAAGDGLANLYDLDLSLWDSVAEEFPVRAFALFQVGTEHNPAGRDFPSQYVQDALWTGEVSPGSPLEETIQDGLDQLFERYTGTYGMPMHVDRVMVGLAGAELRSIVPDMMQYLAFRGATFGSATITDVRDFWQEPVLPEHTWPIVNETYPEGSPWGFEWLGMLASARHALVPVEP